MKKREERTRAMNTVRFLRRKFTDALDQCVGDRLPFLRAGFPKAIVNHQNKRVGTRDDSMSHLDRPAIKQYHCGAAGAGAYRASHRFRRSLTLARPLYKIRYTVRVQKHHTILAACSSLFPSTGSQQHRQAVAVTFPCASVCSAVL